MQHAAFSLVSNKKLVRGTFGAAGPVRKIDPKDYCGPDDQA